MKTVRTIEQVITRDEEITALPEYAVGDYMEVYNGQYEGHRFWVKDVRYNHDFGSYEYLYDGMLMGGWYTRNNIVLLEKAAGA